MEALLTVPCECRRDKLSGSTGCEKSLKLQVLVCFNVLNWEG